MRFSIKDGVISCVLVKEGVTMRDGAITTVDRFCSYHKVEHPALGSTEDEYLVWFMGVIESKKLSAIYAVQEASEGYTAKLRKERAREQEFFKNKGTMRFRGNQDRLRSCNYCDKKFISVGGARKCDDCIDKTADFYYNQ